MEKGGATYEDVNYQGTINVVDAARDAGVERFDQHVPERRDDPITSRAFCAAKDARSSTSPNPA